MASFYDKERARFIRAELTRKERLYHSRTTDEIRAANQICRERKKKPACLDGKQAGVGARRNTAESRTERAGYRGIERVKFTMINIISLNALTQMPLYTLRTCTLAIYSTLDGN